MSPWRGELEGGDSVLFLDSVLGDSHRVVFRIALPPDDNLKLSHASLPTHICTYDEFFCRQYWSSRQIHHARFSPHAHDLLTYADMIEAKQCS